MIFTFTGSFIIKAENKEEAERIIEEDCGMSFGDIHSSVDDVDWNFDMIQEKKIEF